MTGFDGLDWHHYFLSELRLIRESISSRLDRGTYKRWWWPFARSPLDKDSRATLLQLHTLICSVERTYEEVSTFELASPWNANIAERLNLILPNASLRLRLFNEMLALAGTNRMLKEKLSAVEQELRESTFNGGGGI